MTRRLAATVFAVCLVGLANCPAAEEAAVQEDTGQNAGDALIQYVPLDAPAGMSQAVIVQGLPLVHTRQLLPLDRNGQLIGAGSLDAQVEQALNNLEAVLSASGSSLDQLVRLNIYALAPPTVDLVRQQLGKRLEPSVRPAITGVLTPMPHRDALVALDAVAVTKASDQDNSNVTVQRCEAVAAWEEIADAAVLPPGGVAYLSGVPAEGGLTESAVGKSMAGLMKNLADLQLSPRDVVQLKAFLRPATAANEVLLELKKWFPDQSTPPVVFVEWIAGPPVEIELIARWPATEPTTPNVQYYNPPDVRPLLTFSRVSLVGDPRQIYISGLFARESGRGDDQARDVFAQLQNILEQTGSDMRHLAKATYYTSDDDAGRGFDRVRFQLFDPKSPPAASKVMVYGVGKADRSLTMDMIAVGSGD